MTSIRHKARNQRCAICGRIAETGKHTDLGWTGPECQRKVAALPQLLDSLGLSRYGTVIQVPVERTEIGIVEYQAPYSGLQQRLNRAGLTLERIGGIDWHADPPVATFRVTVRKVRQFNTAIKSFTQSRREFEDRLKAGSEARAWSLG